MDISKKDIIFICRNPVDKILSAYFFLDHNLSFDEFVKYFDETLYFNLMKTPRFNDILGASQIFVKWRLFCKKLIILI